MLRRRLLHDGGDPRHQKRPAAGGRRPPAAASARSSSARANRLAVVQRLGTPVGRTPCQRRRRELLASLVIAFGAARLILVAFGAARLILVPDAAPMPRDLAAAHNPTGHEPVVDRWRRRFSSTSGFLFFKHMRKAGGTALRRPLFAALRYHGHGTLEQFMHQTREEEARRHFSFLNWRQRRVMEEYYDNRTVASDRTTTTQHRVYYIEQEFEAMDWKCRDADPRWNHSLSVIVLRHPIERHLSEFMYSGPPASAKFDGIQYGARKIGKRKGAEDKFVMDRGKPFQIDRTKLYANRTYTEALAAFLEEQLQSWVQTKPNEQSLQSYFFQRYVDNFQLRALAGCASEECLGNDTTTFNADRIVEGRQAIPSSDNLSINSVCTMHPFYDRTLERGGDLSMCRNDPRVCPNSCDGPCFYPAAPWGPLNETHLARALHSLEGFDVVLLTETLDDEGQRALLADALGVPRRAMERQTSDEGESNVRVKKKGYREKKHYYRDLMSNLTRLRPNHAVQSLIEENKLELMLYEHAVQLNKVMTERWKREVGWKVAND